MSSHAHIQQIVEEISKEDVQIEKISNLISEFIDSSVQQINESADSKEENSNDDQKLSSLKVKKAHVANLIDQLTSIVRSACLYKNREVLKQLVQKLEGIQSAFQDTVICYELA